MEKSLRFLESFLNTPPAIDTWISPSNGLRKEGNQWKIKGHGKFDAVVIAHNGKCADRLTSKINCKRINRLLRVTFNDTPSTNKMTLNSIYSLIVEIQKDVLRKDIDGMFCSDKSQILDSMFCQNRKYATLFWSFLIQVRQIQQMHQLQYPLKKYHTFLFLRIVVERLENRRLK